MEPKELAALMQLPRAERVEYQHEDGWSFATHSNGVEAQSHRTLFTEDQMHAYALAHMLAERDKWRKVLAESCDAFRSEMMYEAGCSGGCSRATEAESDLAMLRAELESLLSRQAIRV